MARSKKQKEEVKAVVGKASIHDYDTIIRPIITEKTMALMQNHNKVTVEVPSTANRAEVKLAFEKVFAVEVIDVNIINVSAKKTRRGGRYEGSIPGYKKAIVQIKEGEALDLFKE